MQLLEARVAKAVRNIMGATSITPRAARIISQLNFFGYLRMAPKTDFPEQSWRCSGVSLFTGGSKLAVACAVGAQNGT